MLQKAFIKYWFSSFSNVQLVVIKWHISLQFIIQLIVQIHLRKFQIQLLSLLKFNISHYVFYLYIYWSWRNNFISAPGTFFCSGIQKHMHNIIIKNIGKIKLHVSFPESEMCLQTPNRDVNHWNTHVVCL